MTATRPVLPQGGQRCQGPSVDRPIQTESFRLDLPWHLDLDLSEEVYGRLLAISQASGRSIREIAEVLMCACVAELAAEENP